MSEPTNTPLTPPAPSTELNLSVPEPPQPVVAEQASSIAPPVDEAKKPELDRKVDSFVDSLLSEQIGSPNFAAKADVVRAMGDADIRRAAEASNRLLDTPIQEVNSGGISEVSQVGQSLVELRRVVEELDPSAVSKPKRKILGIFPVGQKVEDYFRKYQSSQQHLNAILHSLRSGQDELTRDNTSLNMEKVQLWETMERLNQYIYMAGQLDEQLSAKIEELKYSDPAKADTLSKDVLFYVRQKHQDLMTQLAVSIQGYLSMDIIIKNNIELIKGVDRASTTTVSALRTAVLVSQALGNQKLVLDQITALNQTTSSMIETTSEMLKNNSVGIQQQAASSSIGMESLQKAFENVYETMDSIDNFKVEALKTMEQTIGTLESEVSKSRLYLDRAIRSENNRVIANPLDVPELDR